MGEAKLPAYSKLIIGLIYHKDSIKDKAQDALKNKFGGIDFVSKPLDFDYTDYYYLELGKPLKRLFISFKRLLREDALPEIKIWTNKLERRFSLSGGAARLINIDPGFLSLGKLILATTKDQQHRIYLGKGIFAEVTLFFRDKTFRPWDWTYLDYKAKDYIDIFNSIRLNYLQQLRASGRAIPKA